MIRRGALAVALFFLGGCGMVHKAGPADGGARAGDAASAASPSPADAAGGSPAAPETPGEEPARPHAPVEGRCGAGEVAILLAPQEEGCVLECKSTAGCPAGWVCDDEGIRSENGKPAGMVKFCRFAARAGSRDGGPAPHAGPVDAGKTPAAPAAPVAPSPVDAGKPAPPPQAKRLDVKPAGGQCPAGYRTCGAICRMTCSSDAACGLSTAHCQAGFCLGPGAKPCGK